MSQKDDEINIAESFAFVGGFFNSVYKGITTVVSFSFQYRILLLAFIIIGVVGGIIQYKFSQRIYQSDLIVFSVYLDNEYCAEILRNLQAYVDDESFNMLAEKLEINPEEAKKIKKIYFSNVNKKLEKKYEESDTVLSGLPFRVNVCVTDYHIFQNLKPALLNYFEKNQYVIEERTVRHENSKLIIDKIEKQLTELDSLKKIVSNHLVPRGPQTGFVFGQPLDPLNIYREGFSLFKEELERNSELIRTEKCLRVIRDFEVREKPFRPKLLISLPVGSLLGLFAGLVASFILYKRKRLLTQ